MVEYSFVTIWRITASIEAIWDAILDVEKWPFWWEYVERVVEIEPGNAKGLGAKHRFLEDTITV